MGMKSHVLHLKVWVLVAIILGILILVVLWLLWCSVALKIKSRKRVDRITQIRDVYSREIRVVDHNSSIVDNDVELHLQGKKDWDELVLVDSKDIQSAACLEKKGGSSAAFNNNKPYLSSAASPLPGLTELSQLDWGHWFTLRDLQTATNNFSKDNVIGEGGYGIVYRGQLVNGTTVAVKRLLNNLGQAGKEFRVEVEAIGHVRHKNLVRLLGYCIEGTHRVLVYEYVNNGNLEQWLHGGDQIQMFLTWEGRMKILLGTAKALAYLHDAIEPKVVHRDIKTSNILVDRDFNAKISDFGLAKLMGAGESHIITRVMGTFGYVAPEYASSGILNEKTDVYSFGVVLLEAITARGPVDDNTGNLVEWVKMMVAAKRCDQLLDANMEMRPSTSSLKRALLTALRCVDPNSQQRPTMNQVVRMLDSHEYPFIPRQPRTRH
ncbi:hypothetical protein ABFS82_14G000500 [Erythranthe guttata]|uniref:probable receptor-like protein kinase At5g18500 n=1 Tax=Erythranthe guttata TaxID=4155 RepID=UPI00064DE0A9|nr:PREDICTED: probable receptor-like protein kinase At5g18500 [Erythranthe guttata]|eukprot:XP_012841797.1 PREDICTED: probable receptor-like protein kinase At5g18500 [Erythranthe guttata]